MIAIRIALHALGLAEHPDKAPSPRSAKWPGIRRLWLKQNPSCVACGGRDGVEAHHVVPFHLEPDRELDLTNLISLCEKGPGSTNCHCLVGHCGDWRAYNPMAREDALRLRSILDQKQYVRVEVIEGPLLDQTRVLDVVLEMGNEGWDLAFRFDRPVRIALLKLEMAERLAQEISQVASAIRQREN